MSIVDHPAVQAVEAAVANILRNDPNLLQSQVRERIRVEVTPETASALIAVGTSDTVRPYDPRQEIGPMKVNSVSYYTVDNLPAPGWRVIAP